MARSCSRICIAFSHGRPHDFFQKWAMGESGWRSPSGVQGQSPGESLGRSTQKLTTLFQNNASSNETLDNICSTESTLQYFQRGGGQLLPHFAHVCWRPCFFLDTTKYEWKILIVVRLPHHAIEIEELEAKLEGFLKGKLTNRYWKKLD